MARILVGVGAGVAAYKVAYLVRRMKSEGHQVWVCPTAKSLGFVGEETWQALSEQPILRGPLGAANQAGHIEVARQADLIVIAPATADLIARIRAGIADDMLTTTILAANVPVVVAPAMHTNMWSNKATADNVATLQERGFVFVGPVEGKLSSGDTGLGRLAEVDDIYEACQSALEANAESDGSMRGVHAIVTAGGTRESLDPVRYLANRSSGKQGIEIAKALARRGAHVDLIAAECSVAMPQDPKIRVTRAFSATEMESAIQQRLEGTQLLVMTAAVADYRAAEVATRKLKKEDLGSDPVIRLRQNPDILREVCAGPNRPKIVVGFAAETGTLAEAVDVGKRKIHDKGADLLAVNVVGDNVGFGNVPNEIVVLDQQGMEIAQAKGSKAQVAARLVAAIAQEFKNDTQE